MSNFISNSRSSSSSSTSAPTKELDVIINRDSGQRGIIDVSEAHTLADVRELIKEWDDEICVPNFAFHRIRTNEPGSAHISQKQEEKKLAWDYVGKEGLGLMIKTKNIRPSCPQSSFQETKRDQEEKSDDVANTNQVAQNTEEESKRRNSCNHKGQSTIGDHDHNTDDYDADEEEEEREHFLTARSKREDSKAVFDSDMALDDDCPLHNLRDGTKSYETPPPENLVEDIDKEGAPLRKLTLPTSSKPSIPKSRQAKRKNSRVGPRASIMLEKIRKRKRTLTTVEDSESESSCESTGISANDKKRRRISKTNAPSFQDVHARQRSRKSQKKKTQDAKGSVRSNPIEIDGYGSYDTTYKNTGDITDGQNQDRRRSSRSVKPRSIVTSNEVGNITDSLKRTITDEIVFPAPRNPFHEKGEQLWKTFSKYPLKYLKCAKDPDPLRDWIFYPVKHGSSRNVKHRGTQGIHYATNYQELGEIGDKYGSDIDAWPSLPVQVRVVGSEIQQQVVESITLHIGAIDNIGSSQVKGSVNAATSGPEIDNGVDIELKDVESPR